MSERAREPLFFEDAAEVAEAEPATESAGSGGSRTAVGSGLGDSGGEDEPPIEVGIVRDDDPRGEGPTLERRLGTAIRLLHHVYSLRIEALNLSLRSYNSLRKGGLITVVHILSRSEEELLALGNFDRNCYDEMRERLDEIGIVPRDADWDSARGVN